MTIAHCTSELEKLLSLQENKLVLSYEMELFWSPAYDCKLANKDPNHKELVIVRPLVVLNPTTINNGLVRLCNM